jgi:hypothetical protein
MEDQWNVAISIWKKIVLEFKNVDVCKPNMPGYSIDKKGM